MIRNLRRIETLEHRAGINPLSGMRDDALQAALNAVQTELGDDGPPDGLSLNAMLSWFERELGSVH